VPAKVFLPARVGGGFHIAGVGSQVQKRMLKNLARVVALGVLRHGIMHRLVLFVLELQRHNGQAIEEEHKINLLVRLAKVKMRPKGDAVLPVLLRSSTLVGTWLGVKQPKLQRPHLQAVAQQHPQRRVGQFAAQGLEHLVTRIGAIGGGKLFKRIRLRRVQESP
jgi:hypothetical protein